MRVRHVDRGSRLRVVITDAQGRPVASGGLGRWLEQAAPRRARGVVSVALVEDRVIRRLNRTHRGKDATTDVLSFPGDGEYLGDILISSETAYDQSRKSSTLSFESNVRRLVLHGLLHLMGYDHETDNGEMRTIERRLRRRFQC